MLFVGKLIPLHGLETILEAARLCEEIAFDVVGSGQLDALLERSTPNVTLAAVGRVRTPSLRSYNEAGCALGIFGTSEKAARVIPNKAFQALATGTPLITSDTPAAASSSRTARDALLVPAGDPEALATAVRRLAANPQLSREIGSNGRATYVAQASEEVLGRRWRELLEHVAS